MYSFAFVPVFHLEPILDSNHNNVMDIATVTFDLEPQILKSEGGYVVRKAPKIFESGDYPDKFFSITPEELRAASVFHRDPIKIELEHKNTVLSGKLGDVFSLGTSDDGKILFGEARIPEWLDKVLSATERKLSASWDRQTKRLKEISLVTNPRIADAHLVAAFAAYESGQPALQGVELIASIRGMAASALEGAGPKIFSKSYLATLQKIVDLADKSGAGEKSTEEEGATMSKETLTPELATFKAEYDAKLKALEADNERLKNKSDDSERKRIASEAASFARQLIEVDHKAIPAEKDHIVKAYVRAANADVAEFSASGKDADALKELREGYAARPAHTLTRETVASFRILGNGDGAESEEDKTRKQMKEHCDARNAAMAGNGKA